MKEKDFYNSKIIEHGHILNELNDENFELKRKINENEINLNDLMMQLAQEKDVLDALTAYINYVNTQESTLNEIEKQKESFKNIYFTKDNKDKTSK